MITYDGKVWHPSLYDMDSTCGLFWQSNLWSKFEQAFGDEIYARYVELRANELSDENIIAEFEYFIDGIGQELYDHDQIKKFLIDRQPYLQA